MKRSTCILATTLLMFFGSASAQSPTATEAAWPTKPIKIIVPFPAGGGYDFVARNMGAHLSERLGQPVVVENRVGANGNIGSDAVAKSAADGYTLLLGGIGPQALSPALYPQLPYNPIRDFQPIALLATQPNVLLVHPAVPAKNVAELIGYAKANPGKLTFGSTGNGSGQHFGLEQLRQVAGIDVIHVPYKGAAPLHMALLSGEVGAGFNIVQLPMQNVRKGDLRVLATASKKRSVLAPDTPTLAELGMPIDFDTWYALYAPAGIPLHLASRLNAEVNRILELPEFKEKAGALGIELQGGTPARLASHMQEEITRWSRLARAANIKADQ